MTVGKKLTASVALMLILALVLGVTSLNSIGKLNAQLETATDKTARRLQLGAAMDAAGSNMLAAMRGIVMFSYAKMPDKVQSSKGLFEQSADVWQKSIDAVRPLIIREDGRKCIDRLEEELRAWRNVIVAIEKEAGEGKPEAALVIAIDKGFPIYDANTRDTKVFREIQDEILGGQRADGQSLNNASRWTVIGLLVFSLLVGVGVLFIVRQTSSTLQRAASEVSQTAHDVASSADQISSSSQALAQGASEQAASIEETSASSEEITAMTKENADHARAAAELMVETSQVVSEANRTLAQMETSMHEINSSSDKISKIIKVIDEIAFQTNILALNAAVEAARAGEAGMGFAVVADEVRNLAQRSAQAAKDTAALIEESISKSAEGRVKLDQVATAIRAITERSDKVRTLVDEVKTGSNEQARGIEQIAKAINQMEKVTQSSAANAEEAASAGEELSSQATGLKRVVEDLENLVGATH